MAATATAPKANNKKKSAPVINDRDMREDHSVWLHQALGMQVYETLPEKLVEKYWELKRIADRSGFGLSQHDIAMACFLLGFGKPTAQEDMPPTVLQLYRLGQVKKGAPVEANHRNTWLAGELLEVTGNNELVVQLTGDPDERRFSDENVRLPEVAEE